MPFLFARKRDKMRRSAHAFFRGCAPLFMESSDVRRREGDQGIPGTLE